MVAAVRTITATTAICTTPTEIAAVFDGDRTVLTRLAAGDLLAPRPLPPAGSQARVALVQPSASLLRGDALSIRIELGPGARVELLDVAAMVAQHGRGGPPASLKIVAQIAADAALTWDAKPLVLCEGCAVKRRIVIELAPGATALLRDTLVFGRCREGSGALDTGTVVTYDGTPLLYEALDTSNLEVFRSPAVAGEAHVLDTVAIYGRRGRGPGVLQLAGLGTLLIVPSREAADADTVTAAAFAEWRTSD
jgi:urease accessory protein